MEYRVRYYGVALMEAFFAIFQPFYCFRRRPTGRAIQAGGHPMSGVSHRIELVESLRMPSAI
jgi:hypothetical protein